MSEVKRYVLDIKNGVQEYQPHDYYPATTSLPMVLASDHDSRIASLEAQLAEARKECEEQARLNGAGASREAALMARLAESEKALSILIHTPAVLDALGRNHTENCVCGLCLARAHLTKEPRK